MDKDRGFTLSPEFQVLAIKLLSELLISLVQKRSLTPEEAECVGLLKEAEEFVKRWSVVEGGIPESPMEVVLPTPPVPPIPPPDRLEQPDPPKKKGFLWW